MVYRCIAPDWLLEDQPGTRKVLEGEFSDERLAELNAQGYNIYYLPNYPSHYEPGKPVDGSSIDIFKYVFADMDLKEGKYASKEDFIDLILGSNIEPTSIVDSGGGVHVYWAVSDLDAMSFLKLQRRLIRRFNTDEAVGQIFQLMRLPDTLNTKLKDNFRMCEVIHSSDITYTCEQLDGLLPTITTADEEYCQRHYERTYTRKERTARIDSKVPTKFLDMVKNSPEIRKLWEAEIGVRSKSDYRLGHLMHANYFTREEAISVLVNTSKAKERAPVHQVSYAEHIVDKIWTFEAAADKTKVMLSSSVRDILSKGDDVLKGEPFRCHKWIDDTAHGFRLGQVIGLVAGSGVGKTAVALNMFHWFVRNNPNYIHFFVSLEQPKGEIAARWRTLCGEETHLHDKVRVIDNYDDVTGAFRHLSFDTIKNYIIEFQKTPNTKAGCVVIDHIGALKKGAKDGRQSIEDICHAMKGFALETKTLVIMQSQAPREKASIGDIELDKDAAYGTVYFESYCDYLITLWQPLKRCYSDPKCPTVVAYKFCKIRHKRKNEDRIQEDVRYLLYFDPTTEQMRELSEEHEKGFTFWNNAATNKRKQDKKTDVLPYESTRLVPHVAGKTDSDQDSVGTSTTDGLH